MKNCNNHHILYLFSIFFVISLILGISCIFFVDFNIIFSYIERVIAPRPKSVFRLLFFCSLVRFRPSFAARFVFPSLFNTPLFSQPRRIKKVVKNKSRKRKIINKLNYLWKKMFLRKKGWVGTSWWIFFWDFFFLDKSPLQIFFISGQICD